MPLSRLVLYLLQYLWRRVTVWRLPQAAAQVSSASSTCPQPGGYLTHCLSRPLGDGSGGERCDRKVCVRRRACASPHTLKEHSRTLYVCCRRRRLDEAKVGCDCRLLCGPQRGLSVCAVKSCVACSRFRRAAPLCCVLRGVISSV